MLRHKKFYHKKEQEGLEEFEPFSCHFVLTNLRYSVKQKIGETFEDFS